VNEQARLLLSAYRHSGGDANDPAFAEALALAQRDPQLRAWLEESQHFDRAISERLRSLDVPPDLRETILAGARLSRAPRWWQSRAFPGPYAMPKPALEGCSPRQPGLAKRVAVTRPSLLVRRRVQPRS